MKRLVTIAFVVAFSLGTVLAQQRTFVGKIGDSQCGLKHPMGMGSDKDCTLMCVRAGGKFILADQKNNVVYQLDDQKTPEKFAGQMVKVTGTLDEKTKTIKVKSIEPAGKIPAIRAPRRRGKTRVRASRSQRIALVAPISTLTNGAASSGCWQNPAGCTGDS